MAIPAKPFLMSAAAKEFGVALPAKFSAIYAKAGLGSTGLASRLAGKSAFTKTNTMTVGVNANGNMWGYNSVAVFGGLSPKTAAGLSFSYIYFSAGKLQVSLSAAATAAGTYRITFVNGLTSTFTVAAGKTFTTFGTDAATVAFHTAVGTYFKAQVGKAVDLAVVKIA